MRENNNKDKAFFRKTLKVVGATYLILLLVFVYGYFFVKVDIGIFGSLYVPQVITGWYLAILASPIAFIVSAIYIARKHKSWRVFFLYCALMVGMFFIVDEMWYFGSIISERVVNVVRTEERKTYVDKTIGPAILDVYPNAKFRMDGALGTIVELHGYEYEKQPDFDEEIAKWREIKKEKSVKNYPQGISVRYYFKNTADNFATLYLSDFRVSYSSSGMSEDGLNQVMEALRQYLGDRDDYKRRHSLGPSDYILFIQIDKDPIDVDEIAEREMWQDFVKVNNINTELAEIYVSYCNTSTDTDTCYSYPERTYVVGHDNWTD